jgi:ABC-type transporter Mla subunit MlaD
VVEEVAALGPENDREAQAYAQLFVHARGDLIYLLTEVERLGARVSALSRQLEGAMRSLQRALAELSEKDTDGALRYAQDNETKADTEPCVDD